MGPIYLLDEYSYTGSILNVPWNQHLKVSHYMFSIKLFNYQETVDDDLSSEIRHFIFFQETFG